MDRHERSSKSPTQRNTTVRSVDRELNPQESAKQRASRVRTSYLPGGNLRSRIESWRQFLLECFRSGDHVARLKDILIVIVITCGLFGTGVVVIWVVPAAMENDSSQDNRIWQQIRQGASRGALATSHAIWEDNCQACHIPYYPIHDEHWATHVISSGDDQSMSSNHRCEKCHLGPPHHANQKLESELACARCHQEHRGREHSLVRLADSKCIQCHTQLSKTMKADNGKLPAQLQIHRFALNQHPEFEDVLTTDPGGLKFNHQVHMTPGMGKSQDAPLFRYADIRDAQARQRYLGSDRASSDDYVRLRCQSCHQLDREDGVADQEVEATSAALPARTSGAHFLPIIYENHCQVCHPLDIPERPTERIVQLAASMTERARFERPVGATLSVRHGLDVSQLNDFLTNQYVAVRLRNMGPGPTQKLPARRIPGKPASRESLPDPVAVWQDVRWAQRFLYTGFQTCKKCHFYYDAGVKSLSENHIGKTEAPSIRLDGEWRVLELLENKQLHIWPTAVPEVWFEKADFSHAAHHALRCDQCHPKARSSTWESDVLVPGIQTCVPCHAPTARDGKLVGGARFGCTDCHRYHQVDRPLLGKGARIFAAQRPMTTDEFLLGHQPSAGNEDSKREED